MKFLKGWYKLIAFLKESVYMFKKQTVNSTEHRYGGGTKVPPLCTALVKTLF